MKAAWRDCDVPGDLEGTDWAGEIASWNATLGKPFYFTEIGIQSRDWAAAEPGSSCEEGEAQFNQDLQANYYEAALEVFLENENFAGLLGWNWFPWSDAGGVGDVDFTPQNKKLETEAPRLFSIPALGPIEGAHLGVRCQPMSFSVDFTNPSIIATHTATIDWGDGSPAAVINVDNCGTITESHPYAVGSYTVRVTLEDQYGDQAVAEHDVTIETMVLTEDPYDPTRQALLVGGTNENDKIYLSQYKNGDVKAYIKSPRQVETFSLEPDDRVCVFAGEGNDYVKFYSSVSHDALIVGGPGNDRLYGRNGNDQLDGGDGNDRLYGSNGDDVLLGGSGNDRLYGSRGNDELDGQDGNDSLYGSSGNDTLRGGLGQDYLTAGSGNDSLDGGSHNDRLYGGSGDDSLLGGPGDDRLSASRGDDRLDGGSGNDRLFASSGNDLLFGNLGIDYLSASSGHDVLVGGADNDSLFGGSGRDLLIGGTGNDSLSGSSYDDILIGGNTDHDANDDALIAILAEWREKTPIDDRIANLQAGGGLNGAFVFMLGETVHDDEDQDTLRGGSSGDWFLYFGDDFVRDQGRRDR